MFTFHCLQEALHERRLKQHKCFSVNALKSDILHAALQIKCIQLTEADYAWITDRYLTHLSSAPAHICSQIMQTIIHGFTVISETFYPFSSEHRGGGIFSPGLPCVKRVRWFPLFPVNTPSLLGALIRHHPCRIGPRTQRWWLPLSLFSWWESDLPRGGKRKRFRENLFWLLCP